LMKLIICGYFAGNLWIRLLLATSRKRCMTDL
jgi:hypothetical protein